MKSKALIALTLFAIVAGSHAGTDPDALSPPEVRDLIMTQMTRWSLHPLDVPPLSCTGPGAPAPCCTGVGTGSCRPCGGLACCQPPATAQECLGLARMIHRNPAPWAFAVELQALDDPDWICNTYHRADGQPMTFCPAVPPSPAVIDGDVARWLSTLAANARP